MESETSSWGPLAEAMQAAYDAWQTDDGGDQFILTMQKAMDAWAVYRKQRYGSLATTNSGLSL